MTMPNQPFKSSLAAPFSFSQSSLQDYSDCARRFQLRYIEQLQWPAIETAPVMENERRQIEGQQFHRMVQQYLLGLPVEKITFMADHSNSENLSRWWHNFVDARTNSLANLDNRSYFPEQSLSAPIGKHRLLAKFDLIAIQDGRASIYDWKTYHKRPKDERMTAHLQTKVYMSLLAKAGSQFNQGQPIEAEQIDMVYWYADFPSEPLKIAHNSKQDMRNWQSINDLINEISEKQSFPLTADEGVCNFCRYRSFCERGSTAAQDTNEEYEAAAQTNWDVNLEQIQEIEF